jgi:hypothetical protein
VAVEAAARGVGRGADPSSIDAQSSVTKQCLLRAQLQFGLHEQRPLFPFQPSGRGLRRGRNFIKATRNPCSPPLASDIRKIVNAFDEHQSHENAKHTHRAMLENARQGFWNGAIAPFGYATSAASSISISAEKGLRKA